MAGSTIPATISGAGALPAAEGETPAPCAAALPGPVGTEPPDVNRARAQALSHRRTLEALVALGATDPGVPAMVRDCRRRIQADRGAIALQGLAAIAGIRPEAWAGLDEARRLDALREVHRVYMAAFGMGPVPLRFARLAQGVATSTRGWFDPATGVLTIDDRLVKAAPAGAGAADPDVVSVPPDVAVVDLVNTIVHESRHCVQWRVVRYPRSMPSFDQGAEWEQAFRSPVSPTADFKAYERNAVEADARRVADEAIRHLYPHSLYLPP
jgi:hypothetical protein